MSIDTAGLHFHVYYVNDHEDWGLESFEQAEEAVAFINKQLEGHRHCNIGDFILIRGEILDLAADKVITHIRIK